MKEHDEYDKFLAHYGVKGMHWGIRRYQPYSYTRGRKGGVSGKEVGEAKKKAKYGSVVTAKNIQKAAKVINTSVKAINTFANVVKSGNTIVSTFKKLKVKEVKKQPATQSQKLARQALRDLKGVKLSDIDVNKLNRNVNVVNQVSNLERLSKSTYSGQRNDRVPRVTRKMAKKDAKEYARAKMSIGEGAGNRRKLINAKVKERSKDKVYRQEFEKHLQKQSLAKHADAAKRERKVKDVWNSSTVRSARRIGKEVLIRNGKRIGRKKLSNLNVGNKVVKQVVNELLL